MPNKNAIAVEPAPEPSPQPAQPERPVIPSQPSRDDKANDPPRKVY